MHEVLLNLGIDYFNKPHLVLVLDLGDLNFHLRIQAYIRLDFTALPYHFLCLFCV